MDVEEVVLDHVVAPDQPVKCQRLTYVVVFYAQLVAWTTTTMMLFETLPEIFHQVLVPTLTLTVSEWRSC